MQALDVGENTTSERFVCKVRSPADQSGSHGAPDVVGVPV